MKLKTLLALAERGFKFFPLQPESKFPAVRFTLEATREPEKLTAWAKRYQNFGILCDGLIVLDLDVKANGDQNMHKLAQSTHRMPATFTVRTASGGYHLYFRLPAGADPAAYGNGTHLLADELKAAGVELADEKKTGIDIRSFHGFVVAPGSTLGGKAYEIQEGRDIAVAEAPAWLVELAKRGAAHRGVRRDDAELQHANVDRDQDAARVQAIAWLTGKAAEIMSIKGDGGDDMAYVVACQLRDFGCTYDTACDLMRSEHWGHGYGWGPKLERKPIRSAYLYGQNASGSKANATASSFEASPPPTAEEAAKQQAEGDKVKDAALYAINEVYAMVDVGGKVFVMRENGGAGKSSGMADATAALVTYQSTEDFQKWKGGETIAIGAGLADISRVWLRWPNRRRYSDVVFRPGREVPVGTFNLWRGFAVEPKAGDWEKLKAHIRDNICSGDEPLYTYVLDWMAHAVQRPGEPGHVALVLRGKRGTGKGKLAETLGALYGPHYFHASKPADIVGTFNAHLEYTSLLFADEAFFAGDKQHEAELKRIITERQLSVEQKFLPKRQVANNLHIVMASNERWVIPAGVDERRFTVIDVAATRQQDHAYFQAIDQQMRAEGGLEAMLAELLARDLSAFEPRKAYHTAALVDQKIQSLDAVDRWLHECLEAGQIRTVPMPFEWRADQAVEIDKEQLWRVFDDWQSRAGRHSRRVISAYFWKRMRELFGNQESRPRVDGERVRRFTLPALHEARALFAAELGGVAEWEEERRRSLF